MKNVIAYYITPHGFGHAVRSLEIIGRMLLQAQDLEVVVVSTIPPWLIAQNLGKSLPTRPVTLDVGMVQRDNIRMDLPATLGRLLDLKNRQESLVAEEMRFLRNRRVVGVVSDVAFLPFLAARRCGIPAVGVGNFTWDWIYEAYLHEDPRWKEIVSWVRGAYSACPLFLQLPMHGDCSACPRVRSVPLVARRSHVKPEAVRAELALPGDKKNILLSFTDLELSRGAVDQIQAVDWACFLYRKPLDLNLSNGCNLSESRVLYQDLVAAVDGVITKPGYGIVSDCLMHGTPMLYADRGPFPEYEILVREMKANLPAVHIPAEALVQGHWARYLEDLLALPRKHAVISSDGGAVCARLILDHLGV